MIIQNETVTQQRLYTKAAYAKKIKKSKAWVHKLVQSNKLQVWPVNGTELVIAPEEPIAQN